MRIGIPRALLNYWFGPAWKVFFQELNHTPVVSPRTNKEILKAGVRVAVDEACLPVKIFFGHCLKVIEDCDLLLVPRIVSLKKREYICPKFMGLPEMVARVISEGLPSQCTLQAANDRILVWKSRQNTPWDSMQGLPEGINQLAGKKQIKVALNKAKLAWEEYIKLLRQGYFPAEAEEILAGRRVDKPKEAGRTGIGVIGHPYCLYDGFINLELLNLLEKEDYNYQVLTPELFSEEEISGETADIAKPIFWTLGKRMIGAARALRKRGVPGLIHLAAFACGPEALIGEMIRRECHAYNLPLLQINLDEHSGEAGLLTRVEAFLDLIGTSKGRKEGIGCG